MSMGRAIEHGSEGMSMARMGTIRKWAALLAVLLASPAGAARLSGRIVDPGLHRQWLVERDSAHPERPARLVEVPWSEAAARAGGETAPQPVPRTVQRPVPQPVEVRPGMRVTLRWRDRDAQGRLTGTALEAGRVGDQVWVQAGLHGAVLRAVVRGPAMVELERGRP
jgi:hypothetical protein